MIVKGLNIIGGRCIFLLHLPIIKQFTLLSPLTCMKITLLSLAALISLVCCHPHAGLKPNALQKYVAKVDAEAAVIAADQRSGLVEISPQIYVKPKDSQNVIYNAEGLPIFRTAAMGQNQLVLVDPAQSPIIVESMSEPQGRYLLFTPQAIYSVDEATGVKHKIMRVTPQQQIITPPALTGTI